MKLYKTLWIFVKLCNNSCHNEYETLIPKYRCLMWEKESKQELSCSCLTELELEKMKPEEISGVVIDGKLKTTACLLLFTKFILYRWNVSRVVRYAFRKHNPEAQLYSVWQNDWDFRDFLGPAHVRFVLNPDVFKVLKTRLPGVSSFVLFSSVFVDNDRSVFNINQEDYDENCLEQRLNFATHRLYSISCLLTCTFEDERRRWIEHEAVKDHVRIEEGRRRIVQLIYN